ncbi:hypothetical protein GIB67_006616 [Kingdonia uniflora]|uniref:Uncharacterized protein n=1 Tax=Kingdonia uniflora TaxID=39325 RepID=A0A7J7LEC8_9MAGN|nr:hypothetical protein GIB67_006616 [Kingdonia uniflora]
MQAYCGLNDLNLNAPPAPVVAPIVAQSHTRAKRMVKAKRKTTTPAPTPSVLEDHVEEVDDSETFNKYKYKNASHWSADDFVNLACAWSQVSQNLKTSNQQKASRFWLKVRDQFNLFYADQSMWRSYNGVNCAYKNWLNKECAIFRGILQDIEHRQFTGLGTDDVLVKDREIKIDLFDYTNVVEMLSVIALLVVELLAIILVLINETGHGEWERPRPGRRPDIFPQFSPMKTPLPPPLPADPEEEEDEEEEEGKEEEEQEEDPDKQE